MNDLQDRTVVVTGATSGLGRAAAIRFREEGANVVGVGRNAEALDELAALGVITQEVDVSRDSQVRGMIDLAVRETGRVDVLVNNAGHALHRHVEDLRADEFERLVAVHLFGCLYGMRAVIPVMRAQGYGRIINVVSRAAEIRRPGMSAYGASKAAMWVASRSAAAEVADDDILVNMMFPGLTNTGIWGTDQPGMQPPEAAYPTFRMLATLPTGGPSGTVFYREQPYEMFEPGNSDQLCSDLTDAKSRPGASSRVAE